MDKFDWKKAFKHLYRPPADHFDLLVIPPMQYLMIDGEGDPNTAPAYTIAVQWLYSLSYALKFAGKAIGRDHVVFPLEGLWWADDMDAFIRREKSSWKWTMMIAQPHWITQDMLEDCLPKARAKLGDPPKSLRLAMLEEGECVQIMHVGPYDAEGPVLERLHHDYLPANGLKETGHHHEIYLGDPRKSAPEKLKTILRQPVRRI